MRVSHVRLPPPFSRRRVGRVADKKITRRREAFTGQPRQRSGLVTLRFNPACPYAHAKRKHAFLKTRFLANANFWIKNIMPSLSSPPPFSRQCSPNREFETISVKNRPVFQSHLVLSFPLSLQTILCNISRVAKSGYKEWQMIEVYASKLNLI